VPRARRGFLKTNSAGAERQMAPRLAPFLRSKGTWITTLGNLGWHHVSYSVWLICYLYY